MEPLQILIFLVVGGIYFVNWLIAQSGKSGKADPPPSSPQQQLGRPIATQNTEKESEGERVRRFMEALGLPTGSLPPPTAPKPPTPSAIPAQTQPPPPVRRSFSPTPAPPPLPTKETPVFRREPTPATGTQESDAYNIEGSANEADLNTWGHETSRNLTRAEQVTADAVRATADAQASIDLATAAYAIDDDAYAHKSSKKPVKSALTKLLQSPEGMRQAVLLREILGAPKSLQ